MVTKSTDLGSLVALAARMTPEQLARLSDADREALSEAVQRFEMADPVLFAERFLHISAWDRQAEVMRSVRDHDRTAVRSGHKIGKSTSAAALALWWFCTRPRALVVMTSATDDQVRLILWAELTRLYNLSGGASGPVGGHLHESHRTGLTHPDGRRIIGFGTNKSENMGGFSGAELLFIVDEASGVDDEIFDAVEGNRAGGARVIMFGNPTRQVGRFYEAFHGQAGIWNQIHVSSEETPNVREKRVVVPGLANYEYIEEKKAEYGRTSPWYMIRVRGEFPDRAEDAVIGMDLANAAHKGWRQPTPDDGSLEIGVDVARFGDDETVIFARRGKYAYRPVVLQGKSTVDVAEETRRTALRLRTANERPIVRVDGNGVGGGVVDILRLNGDVETQDINGSSSSGGDEHSRMRDRLWFGLRDWLQADGRIEHDQRLIDEMKAPTYSFDVKNRIKVEGKDDIRLKLRPRRSPDRADALALAVHENWTAAASKYDSPPYAEEQPDWHERQIARRLEEICGGF